MPSNASSGSARSSGHSQARERLCGMSEEATIHLETEQPSVEAVHDAVTAAIAEADHREQVEEAIEEIQEEQDEWRQTSSALLTAQSLILDRLATLESQFSVLTTPPEATMVVSAPELSGTPL